MNTREYIAFLMDLSDAAQKAKDEMRAIKTSRRVLTEDEHEQIRELFIEAIADLDIADSDLMEYARAGFIAKAFLVK